MLSFAAPLFFVLVVLVVPVIILGRRRLARGRVRERSAILALRCAGLVVLIVALAQPRWQGQSAAVPVQFVLDTSASIPPATRGDAESWIQSAVRSNRAGAPFR